MKYMLMLFGDESQLIDMSKEASDQIMKDHEDFFTWCEQIEVEITAGEELELSTSAKTFRQDGSVTDGSYFEIKEQFGGFYVIDVDSQHMAEQVAAKCPNHGGVELRPAIAHPED